jgi:hypothetical protein
LTQTDRWECFRAFECGIVLIEKGGRGNEDLKGLASKTSSEKRRKKTGITVKKCQASCSGERAVEGLGENG